MGPRWLFGVKPRAWHAVKNLNLRLSGLAFQGGGRFCFGIVKGGKSRYPHHFKDDPEIFGQSHDSNFLMVFADGGNAVDQLGNARAVHGRVVHELEGYINARVLVEGLRRAGRDLDREGFIDAVELIRRLDLGIADSLSFSPTDHQGLERVYFTHLQAGKFVWRRDLIQGIRDASLKNKIFFPT